MDGTLEVFKGKTYTDVNLSSIEFAKKNTDITTVFPSLTEKIDLSRLEMHVIR